MAIDFNKMSGYDIQARYPDVSRDIIQHFHAEQLMARMARANDDYAYLSDASRLEGLYPKEFLEDVNYRIVANQALDAKSGYTYSSQVYFVEDLKAVIDGAPRTLTTDAINYSKERALAALPDAERKLAVLDQLPDFCDRVLNDCITEFKRDYPAYKDVEIPFPARERATVQEAPAATQQAPARGRQEKAAGNRKPSITEFLEDFKSRPPAASSNTREKDIDRTR